MNRPLSENQLGELPLNETAQATALKTADDYANSAAADYANDPSIDRAPDRLESTMQHRTEASVFDVSLGKVYVVLPAYNEEAGLPELLLEIKKVFAINGREYEVIVVDDASTDDTAKVASQASFHMPVNLVQHEVNQNLPGALRTGFLTALKLSEDHDIIVTMDGDNTHPPAIINALLQRISERYDVSIASRFQNGSRVIGVPWTRVITAFGARMMFKMIMPIPGVRDYTCGYRAYRTYALREAVEFYGDEFVSEKGFSCMADVLLKMRRFKFVFGEVPMLLRYDQKEGGSKMAVIKTIMQTLGLLLKRRFGGY
ncbi:MAG: glycosyltransferase family 2 protein [Planctomycetota bacterium]